MKPDRCVRLHKFNGLRYRRQAYPCTVTVNVIIGIIIDYVRGLTV